MQQASVVPNLGLCGNGAVIGPFFFEDNVNGGNYLQMLNEDVFPRLVEIFGDQFEDGTFKQLWWAQDGAPCHRAMDVRDGLIEFFQDRVVALHHEKEWPARSPDMNPCDYFLWGYLKHKVFTTQPQTLVELRDKINTEVAALKQDPLLVKRSVRDMVRRTQLCIEGDGGHVEGSHA